MNLKHPYRWKVTSRSRLHPEANKYVHDRNDAWMHTTSWKPQILNDAMRTRQEANPTVGDSDKKDLRLDEALSCYFHSLRDNYRPGNLPPIERLMLHLVSLEINQRFRVDEYHPISQDGTLSLEIYQYWFFQRIK